MCDRELDPEVIEAIKVYDPTTFPGGKYPEPLVDQPKLDQLQLMMARQIDVEATDGCPCDPDGVCPHGHPSWLVVVPDIWGA